VKIDECDGIVIGADGRHSLCRDAAGIGRTYLRAASPQGVDRLPTGVKFDIHPCQGIGNVAIKRTQEEGVLVTESGVKAATRELRRAKKVRERRCVIATRPEHTHRAFDNGFHVKTSGAATGQPHWGLMAHCQHIDQLVFKSQVAASGPGRVKTFFGLQKLQAAGCDPRRREHPSIFWLYRVWSQSRRNLGPR